MANNAYACPRGLHDIPLADLDMRHDSDIDYDIVHPKPVTDDKNIWFFWHSGYTTMHPYSKRTVRAWHRRFSKLGWTIRVLDRQPDSLSNVSQFLNDSNPTVFPQAFIDGTITGKYALQHISDLVRFPLLLTHGGVYADVGFIQIGDVNRLWHETVANVDSPFDIITYNFQKNGLTNYFLGAQRDNPFFLRCHQLLLKIWEGQTHTEGMSNSPLLEGVPLIVSSSTFEEDGKVYGPDEVSRLLSDYIIQSQVTSMVMGLIDIEGGWNGPDYVSKHIYGIDYMIGSQLINEMTAWNGPRAFELMSLPLPKEGEPESADQQQAREIIESCLTKSFGFKLAHGLIIRVLGDTLGSLWRKHEGSDDVPQTYAHWLRHGVVFWSQDQLPPREEFSLLKPYKIGPLLGFE